MARLAGERARVRTLRTSAETLTFDTEPWLMATVAGGGAISAVAAELVRDGARILAVEGGPEAPAVIERLRVASSLPIAVITGDTELAGAAVAAGASIVYAAGGLGSPTLSELCVRTGAALVLPAGEPATATVTRRLPADQVMLSVRAGAGFDVEPKEACRALLVSIVESTRPRELAAVAHGIELGASVLAVSDIAAAADFIAIRAALNGQRTIDPSLRLAAALRREPSL